MMRKCHLNTCPVGIATQDPELRKKFKGTSEDIINFFYYVAEECRTLMASLGFRSIDELVGRTDLLKALEQEKSQKSSLLDLSSILTPAFTMRPSAANRNTTNQDHHLLERLDNSFLEQAQPAFTSNSKVVIDTLITNTDRALGTTLSYHVSKMFGENGLKDNTIIINMTGSAGQSLGAFLASGITIKLEGDANDYVGKGLSGGILVIFPSKSSTFKPELNIIVGNVCLYGATSGRAFINGIAAERFAVRNSGAIAVVEGIYIIRTIVMNEGCGDHCAEYMTGGIIVVLGGVGRNFAAGMSGGLAYVYDPKDEFKKKCNMELVDLETLIDTQEMKQIAQLIEDHFNWTESPLAKRLLASWKFSVTKFVKIFPRDYKKALKMIESKLPLVECNQQTNNVTKFIGDIEDCVLNDQAVVRKSETLDKLRGFMKYKRQGDHYRSAKTRSKDWNEISLRLSDDDLKVQGAR